MQREYAAFKERFDRSLWWMLAVAIGRPQALRGG
jgi:hypothetical protein